MDQNLLIVVAFVCVVIGVTLGVVVMAVKYKLKDMKNETVRIQDEMYRNMNELINDVNSRIDTVSHDLETACDEIYRQIEVSVDQAIKHTDSRCDKIIAKSK